MERNAVLTDALPLSTRGSSCMSDILTLELILRRFQMLDTNPVAVKQDGSSPERHESFARVRGFYR